MQTALQLGGGCALGGRPALRRGALRAPTARAVRPGGVRSKTLLRVECIAAPEKTTAPTEFRAWTSPSAKTVPKRDDLKRIMILGAGGLRTST